MPLSDIFIKLVLMKKIDTSSCLLIESSRKKNYAVTRIIAPGVSVDIGVDLLDRNADRSEELGISYYH